MAPVQVPVHPTGAGDRGCQECKASGAFKRYKQQTLGIGGKQRAGMGEGGKEKKREGQSESGDITVQSCVGTGRSGKTTQEVTSGLNAEEWVGYTGQCTSKPQ